MKTSSFFIYSGPGRISVARGVPRDFSLGCRRAMWLAPEISWLKMPRTVFESVYERVLCELGAQNIWNQLHALAGDAEPVLMCWERLRAPDEWCHRRTLAAFLERELNVVIPEITLSKDVAARKAHREIDALPA